MKKLIVACMVLITAAAFGDTGQYFSDTVVARNYGTPGYSTLTNVLHKIGTSVNKTVVLDGGVWALTNSVTWPGNVTLDVREDSRIVGIISGLPFARPEWWGAHPGDDIADGPAITNAVAASLTVLFSPGVYIVDRDIYARTNGTIKGVGHETVLKQAPSPIGKLKEFSSIPMSSGALNDGKLVWGYADDFTLADLTLDCNVDGTQADDTGDWSRTAIGSFGVFGEGNLFDGLRVIGFGTAPNGGDVFVTAFGAADTNDWRPSILQNSFFENAASPTSMLKGVAYTNVHDLHIAHGFMSAPLGVNRYYEPISVTYNSVTYTSKYDFVNAGISWGWTKYSDVVESKTIIRNCVFRNIDLMNPDVAGQACVTFSDAVAGNIIEGNLVENCKGVTFFNVDTGRIDPLIVRGNTLRGVHQGIELQPSGYGCMLRNVLIEDNLIEFEQNYTGPKAWPVSGIRFLQYASVNLTNAITEGGVVKTVDEFLGYSPALSNAVIRNNRVIFTAPTSTYIAAGIGFEDRGALDPTTAHTNTFYSVKVRGNTTRDCVVGTAFRYKGFPLTCTAYTNMASTIDQITIEDHTFLPKLTTSKYTEDIYSDYGKLAFRLNRNVYPVDAVSYLPGEAGFTPSGVNWAYAGSCENPLTFSYGLMNCSGFIGTTGAVFTATHLTNDCIQGHHAFRMTLTDVSTNQGGAFGVSVGNMLPNDVSVLPEQLSFGGWVRVHDSNLTMYAVIQDYSSFQEIDYRHFTAEMTNRWMHIGVVADLPRDKAVTPASLGFQLGVMQKVSDGFHTNGTWDPGTYFDIDNLYIVPGSAKYGAVAAPPGITTSPRPPTSMGVGEVAYAYDPDVAGLYVGNYNTVFTTNRVTYPPNSEYRNLLDGWGGCGFINNYLSPNDTSAVSKIVSNGAYTAYSGRGCMALCVTNVDATEYKAGYYSTVVTTSYDTAEGAAGFDLRNSYYTMGGMFYAQQSNTYLKMRATYDKKLGVAGWDFSEAFTVPVSNWTYHEIQFYAPFWITNVVLQWGYDMTYCGDVVGDIGSVTCSNVLGSTLYLDNLSFGKGTRTGLPKAVREIYSTASTVTDLCPLYDGEIVVSNSVMYMGFNRGFYRISE